MEQLFTDPQNWIALFTLTALELVLGIDNIIFISILSGKLPLAQQEKARKIGLGLAMFMRIALLLALTWVIGLTAPLFSILGEEISGRDIILILGGLFLLAKSTHEIHDRLEGDEGSASGKVAASLTAVIVQILLLDIVFSLDSVITAIGMVQQIEIMIAAVVISVGFMLWFSRPLNALVQRHPTIKMLALSFLLLIGLSLIAEGFDQHIPKGYIYFAMAFSVFVELLNLRMKKAGTPVKLHEAYVAETLATEPAIPASPATKLSAQSAKASRRPRPSGQPPKPSSRPKNPPRK